jgi:glycine betaine/proline transport system substrate-binding protein
MQYTQEVNAIMELFGLDMATITAAGTPIPYTQTPNPTITAVPQPAETPRTEHTNTPKLAPTATPVPKPMIVLGEGRTLNLNLLNSITGYIIQHGYSHPVGMAEIESHSSPSYGEQITQMAAGNIDLMMLVPLFVQTDEVKWRTTMGELTTWREAIDSGNIESLGEKLENDWQSNFVVPSYIIDQNPGLKTVYDIVDYKHVFHTQFLRQGRIDCDYKEAYRDCHEKNALIFGSPSPTYENQLVAYGLTEHVVRSYYSGNDSSRLREALESGEAWLGWQSFTTALTFEMPSGVVLTRLEEPPAEGCQDPGDGCAYPGTSWGEAGMNPELSITAPEVVGFVRKLHLSNTQLQSLHDQNREYAKGNTNTSESPHYHTGIWFLHNHEDVWTDWVPQEVAEKVKASLPPLSEVTVLPTPTIVPIQVKPLGS